MTRSLVPFGSINHTAFGKNPGWIQGDGSVVIINRHFGQVIHVWNCEDNKVLFDGIVRAEQGGGVFLPVDQHGRVGLQQVWRPQTTDMKAWRAAWPEVDVTTLGRLSLECPRGFAEGSDADGNITAKREAEEETGSVVARSRPLGQVCDNTASSPHLTTVQIGFIDLSRHSDAKPDPNEKLVKALQYYRIDEVQHMLASGELYCGYTIAAIGLYLTERFCKLRTFLHVE